MSGGLCARCHHTWAPQNDISLVLCVEHCNDPGKGFHTFILGTHTYTACNLLKAHADKHQEFASRYGDLNLEDAENLTAPEDVTLTGSLPMDWSSHMCLSCLVDSLMVPNHPATQGLAELKKDMQ